jgi:hypothetical protein
VSSDVVDLRGDMSDKLIKKARGPAYIDTHYQMGHCSQNLDNIQVIAVASWVAKEQGDCVLLLQLGYADRGFQYADRGFQVL